MFEIVWYILLLTVTLIGLNILFDYKKYGNKIFECFKKKNNDIDMKDLLINIFKKEIRDKILILDRGKDYFIAVTRYDIFLVQLVNDKINIVGSIKDETFKTRSKNLKEVKNPLAQFIQEIKLLLTKDIEIKPVIIKTNKDCNLSLKDFDKRNIFTLGDFSYLLYKLQHSSFKYSEEEIENKYNELKELLDGNN